MTRKGERSSPTHVSYRFIEPNHAPMTSSLDLFNVLSEPLQMVLAGRCFTAILTKSPRQVQPRQNWGSTDSRYIATEFNLLGRGIVRVTVMSLLSKQPVSVGHLGYNSEKNPLDESHNYFSVIQRSSELGSSCSYSILSSASTSGTCHVHLEPCECDVRSTSCANELSNGTAHLSSEMAPRSCEKSHDKLCGSINESFVFSSSAHNYFSNPVGSTRMCNTCGPIKSTMDTGREEILVCDDREGELVSMWREGCATQFKITSRNTNAGCADQFSYGDIWCDSLHTHTTCYDDTLPDSESFLEEFQCDFEQSSVHIPSDISTSPHMRNLSQSVEHSTTNKFHRWPSHLPLKSSPKEIISRSTSPHSLQCTPSKLSICTPHFTPELFSGSAVRSPLTGSENSSPELFSSPIADTSSVPLKLCSSAAVDVVENTCTCTPAVGKCVRSVPKKRLLKGGPPLQALYVQSSNKDTRTPLSHGNGEGTANCFTPELFS